MVLCMAIFLKADSGASNHCGLITAPGGQNTLASCRIKEVFKPCSDCKDDDKEVDLTSLSERHLWQS